MQNRCGWLVWIGVVMMVMSGCGSSAATVKSPAGDRHEVQGLASWYGEPFHGRQTASGETYNMHQKTAAHKTLPFGTRVRVEEVGTGRSVVVRINDRGPFVDGRVIDLSYQAASNLGMVNDGITEVELDIIQW